MKKNLLLMAGLFGAVLLGSCQKEEEESVFTMPPALTYDASQLKPFYKAGDTIKMTIAVEPHSTQPMKQLDIIRIFGPYNPPNLSGTTHDRVRFDPFVEQCTYSLFYVVKAEDLNRSVTLRETDGSIRLTFGMKCTAANLEGEPADNPVSVLLKNQ